MCLIVFAYKTEEYPFFLAANRDEFYNRPTRKAQFWKTHPELLAGKDLEAGGTWLGVTNEGKFAALTNYRDMSAIKENAPSRGHIVKDFLISNQSTEEYLADLEKNASEYNGFNLIAGKIDNLYYFTNQKQGYEKLKPGYHAISNAFLNTSWPKTETALQYFKDELQSGSPGEENLLDLLGNTTRFPLEKLPNTGLPEEKEKAVSSIFIQTKDYGTRCSTLVYAKENGTLSFVERTYKAGTKKVNGTQRFKLTWK